jgi:hypothetical protein
MTETVTVSCPWQGRFEIHRGEVLYEPNGDGTATYWFSCEPCRREHMRHATIADLNQFRIRGVRTRNAFVQAAREMLFSEISGDDAVLFGIELLHTDDIVGRLQQENPA